MYEIISLVTMSQSYSNSTERRILEQCHSQHPVHSSYYMSFPTQKLPRKYKQNLLLRTFPKADSQLCDFALHHKELD